MLPESPHGCGQNQEVEPQNPREWGLFHEESARRAYQRVASHTHHKLELVSKGFLISKSKPFLGASVDNIQRCQCSDGCPNKVLEYKCPWHLKIKKPSHQIRKRKHTYPRYIDRDVRAPEDRNPKDEEYLRQFTKRCAS